MNQSINQPKVSVIVPVYNCAEHLELFHRSVLQQTFDDFELIYTDDCSTDESFELLKKFQKEDNRIKLNRHEKNKGAGGARNTGLEMAQGEFVCFLDADDFPEKNYLQQLTQAIQAKNAEIVVCNFRMLEEDKAQVNFTSKFKKGVYSGKKALRLFARYIVNAALWNKIFKRSLFEENEIIFPEHIAHQDFATIVRVMERAKKIVIIPDVLYNYATNPNGYTQTAKDLHTYSIFRCFEIIEAHFEKFAPEQLENDIFRQIVVEHTWYNLKERHQKFSPQQLRQYVLNFKNYYTARKWKKHRVGWADMLLLDFIKKSALDDDMKAIVLSADSLWHEAYDYNGFKRFLCKLTYFNLFQ